MAAGGGPAAHDPQALVECAYLSDDHFVHVPAGSEAIVMTTTADTTRKSDSAAETGPPPRRIFEHLPRLLLGELARGIRAEDDAPRLAQKLLADACRERATDIHLDPQSGGMRVRMRIDGEL